MSRHSLMSVVILIWKGCHRKSSGLFHVGLNARHRKMIDLSCCWENVTRMSRSVGREITLDFEQSVVCFDNVTRMTRVRSKPRYYQNDHYGCLFQQLGSVETQGQSSSAGGEPFGVASTGFLLTTGDNLDFKPAGMFSSEESPLKRNRLSTPRARNTRLQKFTSATGQCRSSGHVRGISYECTDLGDCDQQCHHCGAAFWFGERLKGHSNSRKPKTTRDRCREAHINEFMIRLYNGNDARGYELPASNTLGVVVFDSGLTCKDSKPMKTPMSSDTKLTKDKECESVDSTKYRGMIGLWYPKGNNIETIVYADSDHARDCVDHKRTSGICTFIRRCLTSWFSKKQITLFISTAEADYVSSGEACQQALWMKQALIDYVVRLDDVPIMCDNKGSNDLSKNPVQHYRTKHIEILHHCLHDNVQKGHISIEKVLSVDNIDDIVTKLLKRESSNYLHLGLGKMEHIP
nr:retrovirus-related Pol polyprotein from transposon TNT 1-94 [Tanacetum cinerariifolium]